MKKMLLWMLCAVLLLAALPVSLAEEDVEMVPVLAQVPDGWEGPHLWAWSDDGANAFEAWPGEAMQPLGESGWYYAYVPGFVQNAIVSANDAAVQTEGVVIEAGKAADLIVCAKDPLADLSALRTLSMVIKDGYRVEHPAPKKLPEVERELDKFL